MMPDSEKTVVKSVYSKKILTLSPEHTLYDAIDFMAAKEIQDVFVVNREKRLVGQVSQENIIEILSKSRHASVLLCQIMDTCVESVKEDTGLGQCWHMMNESGKRILPVVRDGILVGCINYEQIRAHDYAVPDAMGQQLGSILNNIYEGVCTVDLESRVTYWNASAQRIYGVKPSEIIGKYLADFFPDAILLKVLETGKSYNNIKHMPRDDTEVVISASPLFFNGRMVGAISSERDISDVRNLSIKLQQARDAVQFLEKEVYKKAMNSDSHIIGESHCFSEVLKRVDQISKSQANILLIGESGSGKEVIARLIHSRSDRKGLFVPVNCSAIPPELFESEFFGYEYGAFTGASKHGKAGLFELADGGTLFLDEVAELPANSQAKLLRAVEDREVRRIGSEKPIKIDVRIISATHRDLHEMVDQDDFREDLYYRLDVIRLHIPPLRDRGDDILLFIERFLEEIGHKNKKPGISITQEALDSLLGYSWKGNVRELRNCIEQMVILCEDNLITRDDVPPRILDKGDRKKARIADPSNLSTATEGLEKTMIQDALVKYNYNKSATARFLGVKRSTLYYKLKCYGLDKG